LKRLSLEMVRAWVGDALARAPLEVSVVGDFDRQALINLAARYFGTLDTRPAWPDYKPLERPPFPEGQSITREVPTAIPKGLIVSAYLTDDFWDINRTRRLSVLAEVLSDRMRIGIREKRGASYSPFAFNRSSRAFAGYGLLLTYIQVDPQNVDTITAAVKEIAADLVVHGVTDEELRRAVDPILTGVKDLRRSNDYWLDSVLTGAVRHPQQIEWCRTIVDDYNAVSVQELGALAAKFLQNDRAAVLKIIPEPQK
jgi:zinc protease